MFFLSLKTGVFRSDNQCISFNNLGAFPLENLLERQLATNQNNTLYTQVIVEQSNTKLLMPTSMIYLNINLANHDVIFVVVDFMI